MQILIKIIIIGVEEVASLLSGVGLHVAAITLRERLGAPRAPALAALAAAAAALPSLPTNASQAEAQADMDAWRWLAENDITGKQHKSKCSNQSSFMIQNS